MIRDKKFMEELGKRLNDISEKDRTFIMTKYRKLIDDELAKKRKISDIMKEIGSPVSVANKEKELLKEKNKNKNAFVKFYEAITKDLTEKNYEEELKKKEEKEKRKQEKLKLKEQKRKEKEKERKLKQKEKLKKQKAKNKKIKDVKVIGKVKKDKRIKDVKKLGKVEKEENKENNILSLFKRHNKITDVKKLGKIEKKEEKESKKITKVSILGKFKKENKIKEENNIIEEIKEETEDFIGDISDEISEKHIFETKEQKRKRIILSIIKVVIVCIMIFVWLWISVIAIATVFAYLDGVKFVGLVLGSVAIDLLWLWIMIMLFRLLYHKKNNIKLNIIVTCVLVLTLALGIVLFVKKLYKIESKEDVSEKYSMTSKYDTYILPSDVNKHLSIIFNANYDTQYIVEYDENMLGKVKVDVKYYETYYDYYIKKSSNQLYISLKVDKRDRMSTYINDLKDGVIYDPEELSRYVVKITMSKEDAGRVDILDNNKAITR